MRKLVIGGICIGTMLMAGIAHAQKTTVAIRDFDNKAGVDYRVSDTLIDMLTTALEQSNVFNVVERERLNVVADEQALGASGAVDRSTAAQTGRIKGADYIVYGAVTECSVSKRNTRTYNVNISNSSATLAVDIRFLDSTTSEVVFTKTFSASRSQTAVSGSGYVDIRQGVGHEMAREVIDGIATETVSAVYPPKVAMIQGNRVALSYGDSIFTVGETWAIIRRGTPIKHPDTGDIIGHSEQEIGKVKIVETEDSLSWAEVLSGEPAQGDICEKVSEAPKQSVKREKTNPFKK